MNSVCVCGCGCVYVCLGSVHVLFSECSVYLSVFVYVRTSLPYTFICHLLNLFDNHVIVHLCHYFVSSWGVGPGRGVGGSKFAVFGFRGVF